MTHPFVPATNCCKVEILSTLGGQNLVNVLHFHKAAGYSPSDMLDLGTDVMGIFRDQVALYQSEDHTYNQFRVTDLTTQDGPVVNVWPTTNAGGITQPSLPASSAVVFTKHTAKRGRAYRGRIYIPGIPRSFSTDPVSVTGAWVTDILTELAGLILPAATHDFVHVVLSYYINKVLRSLAEPTPVTNLSADGYLDSQRRRLFGRGT